ncbi:tyrosine-protein phosphatase [Elizabethkingia anophelis]|nr:tyrosine-protein phosphatase [Elizabethkingia anophelis]MCT4063411.1 tyrosine-protein phosphatase [Elizabethkingia anophelis]MCT4109703.1 tyrosine-protein phosphatase [Elizabethkingia anophelis]
MNSLVKFIAIGISFTTLIKAQEREILLQGTYNFRDIGGYHSKDGRKIKWQKIYRSAFLTGLTNEDIQILETRNVAKVIDFRGPKEIEYAPDRLPTNTEHIILSTGSELNTPDDWFALAEEMKHKNENESDQAALRYYKNIKSFGNRYRPMFQELLTLPLDSSIIIHCVGGKDRTGIGVALIEYVLGVDKNSIIKDFELTNKYRERYNKEISYLLEKKYGVSPKRAASYGIAKGKFLQATFDELTKQYGSIDEFVNKELRLSTCEIKKLRDMYLY